MRQSGIKNKVLWISLAPVIVVSLLLGAWMIRTQISQLEGSLQERAHSIAHNLAPASEYGVVSGNTKILQALVKTTLNEPDVAKVTIYDGEHRALVESTNPRHAAGARMPRLAYEYPIYLNSVAVSDYEQERAPSGHEILGWVRVELSRASTAQHKREGLISVALLTLAALGLAGVIAIRIGKGVSGPIIELTRAVEEIGRGRLDTYVSVPTDGELRTLRDGINTMARSLDRYRHAQQQEIERATRSLTLALSELEQRNAELDKARAEALQASRIKSEFLANMSHELRTPLNGIAGFADALRHTPLSHEQADMLDTIGKSSNTLIHLINDILDFSKIEAGKLEIEHIPYNLGEAIDDTLVMLAPSAYQKGLELACSIDPSLPELLFGDPLRVKQVLNNLLSNAIKFTTMGHVAVACGVDRAAGLLRLSVADTGIGLSEEEIRRLFQVFSQADSSITREYGGTGLGLAVSKQLVSLMGGNIGVDSRKGTGACFFVELPLEVEGADQPPAPALAGFHVLVWSPHLETRTALAMQLRRLGATANVVRETAAVAAAGGEHDAILLACPTCNELKPSLQELLAEASAGKGPPILLQTYGVPADTLNMFISGPRVLSVRGFQRTAALAASLLSLIVPGSGPASAAAPPAADRSGTAALSPLRLLLADDNAINRKLVKTLLAGAAVEIVEAADGEQALAAVSAERFDLIFLDVHMPGMSGIDVTARLRREETPNHATPVIALTADALPSTRSHCLAAGFNDVVVKPIDSQGLWRVVRHWTGSDAGPPAAAEPAPPAAAENAADGMSLYDHAAAVHKSGGRPELAVDLLKMLLDELPEQGQALDTAVSAGDAERVRQQVHRLHGSAVYCCTPALAHSSGQLESAARRRDWDAISEWHAVLRQDVADLLDAGLDGLLQPPA